MECPDNLAGDDLFFFFQAEDGIRDHCVTGVQTCALPISKLKHWSPEDAKTELRKRLSQAQQARRPFEKFWQDRKSVV